MIGAHKCHRNSIKAPAAGGAITSSGFSQMDLIASAISLTQTHTHFPSQCLVQCCSPQVRVVAIRLASLALSLKLAVMLHHGNSDGANHSLAIHRRHCDSCEETCACALTATRHDNVASSELRILLLASTRL